MDVSERPNQGWFSLLRWRTDTARDEARNIGLLLVDAKGGFSAFRAAPLSTISPSLHEQGLLDAALLALQRQFEQEQAVTLERLTSLYESLDRSLYLTEPKAVAVKDLDETVTALYRAYVAARGGGISRQTKGALLDRVVTSFRTQGLDVERGAYIGDYIFDAILRRGNRRRALEVLSFAAPRKDWTPVERDAGHFLFALRELSIKGAAVIQPPTEGVSEGAKLTYDRIRRWLRKADVSVATAEEALNPQQQLDLIRS
jgi:hypothetical protein